MKINETIRSRRKQLGLTQEEVANRLGVTATAVYKWESASCYPDITLLPALYVAISIVCILFYTVNKQNLDKIREENEAAMLRKERPPEHGRPCSRGRASRLC